MNLLLDTHVFIWWRTNNNQLLPAAREAIRSASGVWVSAASAWEAAIKASAGRLTIPVSFESGVEESHFNKLSVTFAHAAKVASLPRHHGDPFDRLLIAQAQVEGLTIITHDQQFKRYRVPVLWT